MINAEHIRVIAGRLTQAKTPKKFAPKAKKSQYDKEALKEFLDQKMKKGSTLGIPVDASPDLLVTVNEWDVTTSTISVTDTKGNSYWIYAAMASRVMDADLKFKKELLKNKDKPLTPKQQKEVEKERKFYRRNEH
jgi:hypothetical protein